MSFGCTMQFALRRHAAGEPRVREHDHAVLLDLGADVLHELRVVDALGALLAADEPGHQRRAEDRHLAARVVEREQRDVELAVDDGVPLLVRLEQRGARIDLDLQVDARGLRVARDHLHHVVAHVALAARELVRGAQDDRCRCYGAGRQNCEDSEGCGQGGDYAGGALGFAHWCLLQGIERSATETPRIVAIPA